MVSEFILPLAVVALGGAGAFSAWLGWNKSGEPFDARKFTNGVVTGVIAGIGLTLANAAGILEAVSDQAAWIIIGSLALSIVGVDQIRTTVSSSIANRAEENIVEAVEEEENKEPV